MRPNAKPSLFAILLISTLLCSVGSAQTQGTGVGALRRQFQSPPDDSRIMVRWWWFGPAVTHDELARELQTMKQGGIGGVEVQPVYPLALDDPSTSIQNLPYLSDAFLGQLRFASHTARDLGLRLDLTLGSGWPYGGPQVSISDAAGMLRVQRVRVNSASQRVPVPNINQGEHLLAIFLSPSGGSQPSPESFRELQLAPDGTVALPSDLAGTREVLFFISSRTGQQVKRAAVGAEGFVVNHYDATAVDHYLHNVGDRLMQAFDGVPPYAVFCDSLEVYNSDWTPDFLQEFQRRRGYDLLPYLPALVADAGAKTADIRYDWARTLTELFNERFATPLHDWARQHRTRLRMQDYGTPPATLSSSAIADLPEGEGADWKTLSSTRWASSASHIYGVPVTSSETWTWLHSPVFRASPLDMKAEADRHFLEGINQLVGHGWPYTPPSVTYPGWRFYAAAVFDEKNPWWIAMPDITRYLQRVSFLLRQGSPANDVAVYLPTSDAQAHLRPGHVDLYQTLRDAVGRDLVSRIVESGFTLDFFDDDALRNKGTIGDHSLALGANRYRIVVLPGVERIPLDTYRKLQEFVRAGGSLVATRRLPEAAPGFRATEAQSGDVRQISEQLFSGANPPAHFVKDESASLGQELAGLLTPDVSLSPAAADLGFVHRHVDHAEIYFIANTGNRPLVTTAKFRVAGLQPEWWSPMSGEASPAEVQSRDSSSASVSLDLAPYESRVLVFSTLTSAAPAHRATAAPANTIDLSGGWRVTFGATGVSEQMSQLRSWTDDSRTRYFSGTATFEKTVSLPASALHPGGSAILDFGPGKPLEPHPLKAGMQAWFDPPVREAAVVYVNGQRAGSVWCPPYAVDIARFLHPGENEIRVDVANLALNAMAGQPLPDYRLLNLRYGVRFEAQDMDKVQPIPAGLFGPITLVLRGR